MSPGPFGIVAPGAIDGPRYVGTRTGQPGGALVEFVRGAKIGIEPAHTSAVARSPLPIRLDLRNHSPDGFQWGYGGSGPAQLALAICVHAVGEQRGLRVYQKFKRLAIAPIQDDIWTYRQADVVRIIETIEHDQEDR